MTTIAAFEIKIIEDVRTEFLRLEFNSESELLAIQGQSVIGFFYPSNDKRDNLATARKILAVMKLSVTHDKEFSKIVEKLMELAK